jgi:hypothetical protein
MSEDDFSIDDLMDDIGGVKSPLEDMTPEERMHHEYTSEGKYQKIYNCRYWLNCELSVYNTLLEKNYLITKTSGLSRVAISWNDLARGLLEHYFLMVAFVRFDKSAATPHRPQVDMAKFLDMILEHDEIKRTILQYGR